MLETRKNVQDRKTRLLRKYKRMKKENPLHKDVDVAITLNIGRRTLSEWKNENCLSILLKNYFPIKYNRF